MTCLLHFDIFIWLATMTGAWPFRFQDFENAYATELMLPTVVNDRWCEWIWESVMWRAGLPHSRVNNYNSLFLDFDRVYNILNCDVFCTQTFYFFIYLFFCSVGIIVILSRLCLCKLKIAHLLVSISALQQQTSCQNFARLSN